MVDNKKDYIHKEYPKQFSKTDFWSQIKRTVNGNPVSETDIQLIVNQITCHLSLKNSRLLDIGCGNGALASRLFPQLQAYTGVDFSSYLLEVANEYFKPSSDIKYIESDARKFVAAASDTTIDRVLIYGCMSYFNKDEFREFLVNIANNFPSTEKIFIGNIPDKSQAHSFFKIRGQADYDTDDNQSPIGVWWTTDEVADAANNAGFNTSLLKMPPQFYGYHYRFDALLYR